MRRHALEEVSEVEGEGRGGGAETGEGGQDVACLGEEGEGEVVEVCCWEGEEDVYR